MASGKFDLVKTLGTSSYIYSRCEWSSSGNVANNKSTIWVNVIVGKRSGSNSPTTCTFNTTVSVAGADNPSTQSSSPYTSVKANQEITVFSGSFTIGHNSDGSKGTTISVAIGNNNVYHAEAYSNVTLDKIARASTPTVSGATYMGEEMTIYTNKLANFTHTIRYFFGTQQGTIATNVVDSCKWSVPLELANEIPEAVSGTGTIYCDTINVGTKQCSMTLKVPENIIPTVDIAHGECNPEMVSKGWGIYVKNKTELELVVVGTAQYGAYLKSYNSTIEGISSNKQYYSKKLQTSGLSDITAYTVDSRGRKSEVLTETIEIVDYYKPTINSVSVSRCTEDGIESDAGEYLLYSFIGRIAPVADKNQAQFFISVNKRNSGDTATKYFISNSYDLEATKVILMDSNGEKVKLSADDSYEIQFSATDSFETTYVDKEIGTGFDLINLNKSGNSMAFGKISEATEDEKILEIGFEETRFSGDVTFPDGSMVKDKHVRYSDLESFFADLYKSDGMTGSVYIEQDYLLSDFNITVYSSFYTYTWIPLRTFPITDGLAEKPYNAGTLVLYESTGASTPIIITIHNRSVITAMLMPSGNKEPILRGEYPILVEPFSFYTAYESKDIQTIYNLKGQLLSLYPEKPGFKRTYRLQAIVNSGNNDVELYLAGKKAMTFSIWGSNDTRHGRMMSADITWIINSIDTGHKTLGIYMNSNSSTFVILQYVGIQVFDELETPDGPTTPANINSDNYSESEHMIGTWINGKPLYRKVIVTYDTVQTDIPYAIAHGVTGWDRMWIDLGNSFFYESNRKRSLPLEQTSYTSTSGNDKCHAYVEADYIYIVSVGGWGTGWEKVITLNYTKVND